MAVSRRLERVNKTLMKEISLAISTEVKDPRLVSMVSVLAVEMAPDMKFAKVTVSIYGPNELDNLKTLEALQSSSGYISSIVSNSLRLRWAPHIEFERSRTIEDGVSMYFKIKELARDVKESDNGTDQGSQN